MVIEWKLEGKPSLVGVCVGAIAGLATITPAAGFVKPAAVVIGTASAIFCYACVFGLTKMGYDDALDVWGVHGMGGFLGTCLLGVISASRRVTPLISCPSHDDVGGLFLNFEAVQFSEYSSAQAWIVSCCSIVRSTRLWWPSRS